MSFISKLVIFAAVVIRVYCDNSSCNTGNELANTIINIIDSVLSSGQPVQASEINLVLYTRDNPTTPTTFNTTDISHIDPNKPIKMYIHGWIAPYTGVYAPQLKDAYLAQSDCNVIIVDWDKYATATYTSAVNSIPQVAALIANFFCLLYNNLGIPMSTIHVIGHSLGAQLSGYVGQYVTAFCGQKLGRITGLDPAGPCFQNNAPSQRLDSSDAVQVDIVHTNEGGLGFVGDCGKTDFYVNGGKKQPACPTINLIKLILAIIKLNIVNLENQFALIIACDHGIVLVYFIESINSVNFVSQSASNCAQNCLVNTINPNYIPMGEYCPPNPTSQEYWVPTHTSSPYAEGCPPSTVQCT